MENICKEFASEHSEAEDTPDVSIVLDVKKSLKMEELQEQGSIINPGDVQDKDKKDNEEEQEEIRKTEINQPEETEDKHLSEEDASDDECLWIPNKSEKEMQELIQKIAQERVEAGKPDLRIVLLGKTGSGKSASGNTILGTLDFKTEMSPNSVTRSCEMHVAEVEGQIISVIDTPGICDTSMSEEELKKEIVRCVYMSAPGPHVFLLVIRIGRFTDEEKNTVNWIHKNFGDEAAHYTIILFTHADALDGKALDKYIIENNDLKTLVSQCGDRYHSFHNKGKKKHSQVTELMEKIKKMREENGGQHYTNEKYKKAQEKIKNEVFRQKVFNYGKKALLVTGGVAVAVTGAAAIVATGAAKAGGAVVATGVQGAAAVGARVAKGALTAAAGRLLQFN